AQLGPERRKRRTDPGAERDRDTLLVRDDPRRIGSRGEARGSKESGESRPSAVPVDVDDDVAAITARTPQPIVVMPGDGRGESICAAEKVDGRRLAIVACNDDGLRAAAWRQRAIDAGNRSGELGPAVHVGPILRQARRAMAFRREGRALDV